MQSAPHLTNAHAHEWNLLKEQLVWHPPRSPAEGAAANGYQIASPHYSCAFCGSMHPTEVVEALKAGATHHWADWKYGWPHKLYLDNVPNRYAGHLEIRSYGPGQEKGPEEAAHTTTWGKFYSVHLQDATDEERAILERAMGFRFEFLGDGRVRWFRLGPQH